MVIAMNMQQTLFPALRPKYFIKHCNLFNFISYDVFMFNSDLTLIQIGFIIQHL